MTRREMLPLGIDAEADSGPERRWHADLKPLDGSEVG